MPPEKIDPLNLTSAQAAQIISKAGGEKVTEDEILATIKSGAPALANGNINLIHLGAWLLREMNDVD